MAVKFSLSLSLSLMFSPMATHCYLLVLLLWFLFIHIYAQQQLPIDTTSTTSTTSATIPPRLSNPSVGDDGKLYACYGKNLIAFHGNGSISWTLPLGYSCRTDLSPITDGYGKIYLVAEDRVLKIIPSNIKTSEPALEIFFGPDSSFGGSGEIVGICISVWSSAIFINVRSRALFAFTLRGQLLWSAGPILYRFGYLQGCKENVTDCYFNSAPEFDQCEGSLYISNNEGLLYSMYTRSPHFKWIKDFSSVDKSFLITAGNNGRLYVTFPRKALMMALDVSTGNLLWQNNIGPLSTEDCSPIVDSNGWVSVGSLDGYLYSFSPTGVAVKHLKASSIDSVVQVSPVLDCSGFAVYVSQTRMEEKTSHSIGGYTYTSAMKPTDAVFTMIVPATGAIYWTGKYPGEMSSMLSKSDLRYFRPDEKILLALLASSGANRFSPSYTTRQKLAWTCSQAKPKYLQIYTGNERTILLFLLLQFLIIAVLAISARFCCIFWRKKKLQEQNLGKFIKKRHSLHVKRKQCSRMISELEQKVSEEASDNEVLEQLGDVVRAKEAIERKLSTTYSLGKDRTPRSVSKRTLLPLYDGKSKSYSFHSANKESVTIFDTVSDTSASGEPIESDTSSSSSSTAEACPRSILDMNSAVKGKAPMIEGPSCSGAKVNDKEFSVLANPLYTDSRFTPSRREGKVVMKPVQEQGMMIKRRMWLKRRRRTMSSTN